MSKKAIRSEATRKQPDLFSFEPKPSPSGHVASEVEEREVVDQASPLKPEAPPKPRSVETTSIQTVLVRPVHLLDVSAAAAWLGLSKSTLDKMRCYGTGPRFIRASGKAVRYDPADLAAFADGRRQHRTSDPAPTNAT